MQTILISMLCGLIVNVITWLSGKLKLSKTYVSVILSILIGVGVYAFQLLIKKYPVEREQFMGFVAGAYATSQMVYNLYNKILETKEDKKE